VAGRAFADFHRGKIDGRAALGNGYRRVAAGYVEEEKAADHFLGLGERSIDQRRPGFRLAAADAYGVLVGPQLFGTQQDALPLQRTGEFHHRVVTAVCDLLRDGGTLAAGFDDQKQIGHVWLLAKQMFHRWETGR